MKLEKLTLKQLVELFEQKRLEGYIINPDLNFRGFKGRITKNNYIWILNNLIQSK